MAMSTHYASRYSVQKDNKNADDYLDAISHRYHGIHLRYHGIIGYVLPPIPIPGILIVVT